MLVFDSGVVLVLGTILFCFAYGFNGIFSHWVSVEGYCVEQMNTQRKFFRENGKNYGMTVFSWFVDVLVWCGGFCSVLVQTYK